MQKAEQNPQLVMLSNWDHLTSAEYQKVQEESRVNILYCMDSILINGRGAMWTTAGNALYDVTRSSTTSTRRTTWRSRLQSKPRTVHGWICFCSWAKCPTRLQSKRRTLCTSTSIRPMSLGVGPGFFNWSSTEKA
ncbi:conidial pigment biosynthesis oxidase Arb2/brown2 [Penicillium alfredii]|uniref:Conidial pigment biosynthesis oxidase Arb2/brown2 n=1 Tax=Penicillium alfredii TaxID=1506179 RepID=A0A9W9FQQ3_9EURO|nr:conidial pigment biosynthesis oxidase Arb2/brown2 [Penicillium alfredii]KAJ5104648.1 conidial pigment biosynthesis oxidase Arb2/brown2 [Penicillium alfredii]